MRIVFAMKFAIFTQRTCARGKVIGCVVVVVIVVVVVVVVSTKIAIYRDVDA